MRLGLLIVLAIAGCAGGYRFAPEFTHEYYREPIQLDRWLGPLGVVGTVHACVQLAACELGVRPPGTRARLAYSSTGKFEFRDGRYSIDVPVIGEHVNSFHARTAAFVAVHEMVEMILVVPSLYGADLYGSDLRNRWVGDGLASHIATRALLEVGSPEPRACHQLDVVRAALAAGTRTVTVADWKARLLCVPPAEDDDVKYAVAEYVVSGWYHRCQERGIERPAGELLRWLQKHPRPSAEQVLKWMESAAGINLSLSGIDLTEVGSYYEEVAAAQRSGITD